MGDGDGEKWVWIFILGVELGGFGIYWFGEIEGERGVENNVYIFGLMDFSWIDVYIIYWDRNIRRKNGFGS